jgi:hypothetical protein
MAKAHIVKVDPIPTPPPQVVLTLSVLEAALIRALIGKVGMPGAKLSLAHDIYRVLNIKEIVEEVGNFEIEPAYIKAIYNEEQ